MVPVVVLVHPLFSVKTAPWPAPPLFLASVAEPTEVPAEYAALVRARPALLPHVLASVWVAERYRMEIGRAGSTPGCRLVYMPIELDLGESLIPGGPSPAQAVIEELVEFDGFDPEDAAAFLSFFVSLQVGLAEEAALATSRTIFLECDPDEVGETLLPILGGSPADYRFEVFGEVRAECVKLTAESLLRAGCAEVAISEEKCP